MSYHLIVGVAFAIFIFLFGMTFIISLVAGLVSVVLDYTILHTFLAENFISPGDAIILMRETVFEPYYYYSAKFLVVAYIFTIAYSILKNSIQNIWILGGIISIITNAVWGIYYSFIYPTPAPAMLSSAIIIAVSHNIFMFVGAVIGLAILKMLER